MQRRIITRGYFVRALRPRLQVPEVLSRFDLYRLIAPFSRCIRCNGDLQAVDKQAIEARLETRTRQYYNSFRRCDDCGQIYWQGSHYQRAMRLVDDWRSGEFQPLT